jgi:hypothetical protein
MEPTTLKIGGLLSRARRHTTTFKVCHHTTRE